MSTLLSKDWTSHSQGPPTAGSHHAAWNIHRTRASNEGLRRFHNHGEGLYSTGASSSWLKVPTRDAIKTLCYPPVPYDNCVGLPIQHLFSSVLVVS